MPRKHASGHQLTLHDLELGAETKMLTPLPTGANNVFGDAGEEFQRVDSQMSFSGACDYSLQMNMEQLSPGLSWRGAVRLKGQHLSSFAKRACELMSEESSFEGSSSSEEEEEQLLSATEDQARDVDLLSPVPAQAAAPDTYHGPSTAGAVVPSIE